ncbi:hypothetical protein ACH33_09090 [Aneurinibacillus sp. XH2]|nr:hypothetical protein ACH33_09090 [Aneurinibacillus sp. XH2]
MQLFRQFGHKNGKLVEKISGLSSFIDKTIEKNKLYSLCPVQEAGWKGNFSCKKNSKCKKNGVYFAIFFALNFE